MKIKSIIVSCLFILGIIYCLSGFKEGQGKIGDNGCEIRKGKKCIKCQPGYQLSDDGTFCELRPIQNCNVQDGIKCSVCKNGYVKSSDSTQCEVKKISHCIDQPKNPGNICKNCDKGYILDGNKCWAPAIKDCKTQEDLVCKECKIGYTLRNNQCRPFSA